MKNSEKPSIFLSRKLLLKAYFIVGLRCKLFRSSAYAIICCFFSMKSYQMLNPCIFLGFRSFRPSFVGIQLGQPFRSWVVLTLCVFDPFSVAEHFCLQAKTLILPHPTTPYPNLTLSYSYSYPLFYSILPCLHLSYLPTYPPPYIPHPSLPIPNPELPTYMFLSHINIFSPPCLSIFFSTQKA